MRNLLALLALLAVGGLIALLLFSGGSRRAEEDVTLPEAAPASAPTAIKPGPAPAPSTLAPSGRPRRDAGGAEGGVIRDHGAVVVRLVVPDAERLSAEELAKTVASARVDVDSLGAGLPAYPLALQQEDGTWLYESLPVGKYRVKAVVRGYEVASTVVEVKKAQDVTAELALARGGELQWKATLLSGEAPAWVRLELLDGRGQAVAPTVLTTLGYTHLRADQRPDLPATGRIVGLRAGAYRLRAAAAPPTPNEASEADEKVVEVKAGEVALVELSFRK